MPSCTPGVSTRRPARWPATARKSCLIKKKADQSEVVRAAAACIRSGGLVAFPTETVYGLGANALDRAAVARIFEVKGRPPTSPLIVHVSSVEMARQLVAEWPREAEVLAAHYWPGPLTLVLEKHARVPDTVTAGLSTVGLRIPAHPLALALIREAGVPLAAPSANRFGQLSPTRAEHVRRALGDRVDMILDGGRTTVGIESTVLALAGDRPRLLRPGMILPEQIEVLIGPVEVGRRVEDGPAGDPSPGMRPRHYSPNTPLLVVSGAEIPREGRGAYLRIATPAPRPVSVDILMPAEPARYAAVFYATLHRVDRLALDWIAVERPPADRQWSAVLDRLERAAAPRH